MLYNIQFQVAALLLMALGGFLLVKKKAVRMYSQKTYLLLFITVGISISFDIASVIMIVEMRESIWTQIVCRLYLLSIGVVTYCIWQYVFTEVRTGRKRWKLLHYVSVLPVICLFGVLCGDTVKIYHDGIELYTYGPGVTLTYVCSVLYLLCCFSCSLLFFKDIRPKVRYSVWFMIVVWAVAAAIQMLHNELLIVSFAMAVSIIYMYILMENPETYIDSESGALNAFACTEYLHWMFVMRKKIWAVSVFVERMSFVAEQAGLVYGQNLIDQIMDFFRQEGGKKLLIFRTGSNRFCILCASEEQMETLAGRIAERFDSVWQVEDLNLKLDCKVVYMERTDQITSAGEFLDCMRYFAMEDDTAGTTRVDAGMIVGRNRRLEAEKALHWAIEEGGVRVYYQPIYSIKKGRVHALEALARVEDEAGRLYMPDEFIPIAEKNGMIVRLGAEVLRQVCRFMRESRLEELGIDYVEVNLSVIQCMQENLASQFLDIMAEERVAPYKINLEITETAAVNSDRILLKNMEYLIRVGSTFSLDDYGTGYSGLSYVLKFPVKIIKFDKGMVWSYFSNAKAAVAMRHEIRMLHELGTEIVAEGVEDKEMFDAMKELGIDDIQGYYFSKPVPPKELLALLKKWM